MSHAVLRIATAADAARLGSEMRRSDVEEVWLSSRMRPAEAAGLSWAASEAAFAMDIGGRLACVFGARRIEMRRPGDDVAEIWELGTGVVEERPVAFLRASQEALGEVFRALPSCSVFTNWSLKSNAVYGRWLQKIGAVWTGAERPGLCGGVFRQFIIARNDNAEG